MKIPAALTSQAEKLEAYYSIHYPPLAPLVKQCFLNTIETTVRQLEDGSWFVVTGDIPAMWLRDSTAQVELYTRFAGEDEDLQQILEGVIKKQAEQVLADPYANAFNPDDRDPDRGWKDDTERGPLVWERKYEVDSLCAPVWLAYAYWKATGRTGFFTAQWLQMLRTVIDVFTLEQDHSRSGYYFQRHDCPPTDTLPCEGKGTPVAWTGMTWSGFRPSDDRCEYGYLIPSQIMAVCALRKGAEIAREVYSDSRTQTDALELAKAIEEGIRKHGTVEHPVFGEIYAYEVDGLGHATLMDDGNSPSLLGIPYLGYASADDPLYQRTRSFVLSRENPYYYEGKALGGIGSMHTPANFVWHISIGMEGLTSGDEEVMRRCILRMLETDGGTGCMHEGVNVDDPSVFTRPWFSWANMVFCELVLNYCGFTVRTE